MIPHIDDCYFYSRIDNTIIANLNNGDKITLVRLLQKFPNSLILEEQPYRYMLDYMAMHPHLWELIEIEKPTIRNSRTVQKQLTLF
jgi:hypothetical protein